MLYQYVTVFNRYAAPCLCSNMQQTLVNKQTNIITVTKLF